MDAAELNRRLNRAARFANLAAVAVADGGLPAFTTLTAKLVNVLAEITSVQQSLIRTNPELEYHSDPGRPATAFMREIQKLDREAQVALAMGDVALATRKLSEALDREPPPLVYEILEKRRDEISRSA